LPAKELESANSANNCRRETLAAMMLAAEDNDQRQHEAVLAAEDDNRPCHEAVLAAEDDDQRRHEAVLAAEDNNRHCQEVAARAAEALALVKERCRHEAATRALLSTVSPLADERSCHEAAAGATASAKLALAVRPRARPRRRTGRCNIPCAPSSFIKVTPTHPELLQGGLPTPTQTKLAQATSPCPSEVSSTTPYLTTPHTPSLFPSNLVGFTVSMAGGNAHPFQMGGPTPPPRKRTQRKLRPHRVCCRHGPRAPNPQEHLLRRR
jgi:hypothetical protein